MRQPIRFTGEDRPCPPFGATAPSYGATGDMSHDIIVAGELLDRWPAPWYTSYIVENAQRKGRTMYALMNPESGNFYTFEPSETRDDQIKVTYHRRAAYEIVGHWKSVERARAQYRRLRGIGFVPAAVPAEVAA